MTNIGGRAELLHGVDIDLCGDQLTVIRKTERINGTPHPSEMRKCPWRGFKYAMHSIKRANGSAADRSGTLSPMTVYSWRLSEPMDPQKTDLRCLIHAV